MAPDYGARRGMTLQAEARDLVAVASDPEGREIQLSTPAAGAWVRMRDAAAASGVELVAISGFRSVARQSEIIRGKLAAGETMDAVLATMAAPGYSEHHTGRAIDIGCPGIEPLTEGFERSGAFLWLQAHAHEHGFRISYPRGNAHGIAYEPWHWCFAPG